MHKDFSSSATHKDFSSSAKQKGRRTLVLVRSSMPSVIYRRAFIIFERIAEQVCSNIPQVFITRPKGFFF